MDEERIVEIYRDTVRPLYSTVVGWTRGDRAQTEDVVQETYLRAVRTWRREGAPDRPLAWLRTVARNLVVSDGRKRRPDLEEMRADEPAAPAQPVDREELVAIEAGLETLPAGQAQLLRAFHLEGHTTRDLAERHGISERAVEGRLRRARLALRRLMNREPSPRETDS